MSVRVRLFGVVAERAGVDSAVVALSEQATARDVLLAVGDRYPSAAAILDRMSVAVNLDVVPQEHRLAVGDEVALLPPVAGGAPRVLTGLRDQPSVQEALDAVATPDAGGSVVFVGTVRDEGGAVERLLYSAYEEMAERVLRDIAEEAAVKWSLAGVVILHAIGDLTVGQRTVVVACSSAHRAEAFEAGRYAIEEVKRRAPIWKKETGPGGDRWVGLET